MPFTGLAIQLPQVLLRINRVLLCLGSLICSFTPLRFPPLLFCRLAVVAVGPCRIYRVWHLVILVTFFFFGQHLWAWLSGGVNTLFTSPQSPDSLRGHGSCSRCIWSPSPWRGGPFFPCKHFKDCLWEQHLLMKDFRMSKPLKTVIMSLRISPLQTITGLGEIVSSCAESVFLQVSHTAQQHIPGLLQRSTAPLPKLPWLLLVLPQLTHPSPGKPPGLFQLLPALDFAPLPALTFLSA